MKNGENDFQVTTNDASKTIYLDKDGNEIPEPQKEATKPVKGGIANADKA